MFAILIPAYQPNASLITLVKDLLNVLENDDLFAGIFVVDDGSSLRESKEIFSSLEHLIKVHVLRLTKNHGKGGAIKHGITHISQNQSAVKFIVTADADGQHESNDIIKISKLALENNSPVIGVREFDHGVPLRSRFGNLITRYIFRLFSGYFINDTQSGLRVYHYSDFDEMLAIPDNGYEFEFQALFLTVKRWKKKFTQEPIKTVYEPGNPTSHFSPIADSLKIYAVLLRHVSVSAATSIADFILFSLLTTLSIATLPALIISRSIVTPFYFWSMREYVFKSNNHPLGQIIGTLSLIVVNIAFLWVFIDWLHNSISMPRSLAMGIGILTFYALNFTVQRWLIFKTVPKT